ncbi:hypothetical protein HHI36_015622 [Cryptolaemus montrouzieri]|uniref:Uncharacterized protein n=1 Tax=Cryptolaemus montrouzieri TaxID=559131 RepID=A0ABD2N679_9CUCU
MNTILGSVAAALTTPLDVVKTRIMLADKRRLNLKKLVFAVCSWRFIDKKAYEDCLLDLVLEWRGLV